MHPEPHGPEFQQPIALALLCVQVRADQVGESSPKHLCTQSTCSAVESRNTEPVDRIEKVGSKITKQQAGVGWRLHLHPNDGECLQMGTGSPAQ